MRSKVSYLFSFMLLAFCSVVLFPRWQKPATESTFGWDVGGYYWYLPATFIYKDLRQQRYADSLVAIYRPTPEFSQAHRTANGNYVMKYSAGMALLYTPGFFTAHVLARPLGYPADGFSKPYQMAVQLWGLVVAAIGLWYFRRFLKYYYDDDIVALCLLLLSLGTNYLNYASIDASLSHNYLFALYTLLLLATRRFYLRPTGKGAAGIGLLIGIMALARPTEILAALIPLLWGMESLWPAAIRQRLLFLKSQLPRLALAAICAFAAGAVQLVYWKYTSGHWLVYSYEDQGFSWLHPHIWDYALSYRSGWLVYTPMMFLVLAGIVPFLRSGSNKVMVVTFTLVAFYVVASWDIWWYAGTGGRAMVQFYPLLFIYLAALLQVLRRQRIAAAVFTVLAVVFAYFNIWMTYQQHIGGLYDSEGMTREYFWKVAGRWNPDRAAILPLKDGPYLYTDVPKTPVLIYSNDFEADTSAFADTTAAIHGKRSFKLPGRDSHSPFYSFPTPGLLPHSWLRASATFHCGEKEWTVWKMPQFYITIWKGGRRQRETMIRVLRGMESNSTQRLHVDMYTRSTPPDSVSIHFWNPGSDKQLQVDDLQVHTFAN